MRTVSTTVYKFSELSEQAKENALNNLCDINVKHDWWECTVEDANCVGIQIQSFDIDRGSFLSGVFTQDAEYTANKIKSEHGESTETYKTAIRFFSDWNELVVKYSDGVNTDVVAEDNEGEFDEEAAELESEFLREICEDYLTILRNEYEYLTSEGAIIEAIEANGYEFTEYGDTY